MLTSKLSSIHSNSSTIITIYQHPKILGRSIKGLIEGFNCQYLLLIVRDHYFTLGLEKFKYTRILSKQQYNLKSKMFSRSSPKSIGFSRKHIKTFMQNIKAIGVTSFELSQDKKLTSYTKTHRYTYILYIFGRQLFSQSRSYVTKENGEI